MRTTDQVVPFRLAIDTLERPRGLNTLEEALGGREWAGPRPDLRRKWLPLVTAFLKERGHEVVGQARSATRIDVRIRSSAFIARLQFADVSRQLVVKPIEFNQELRDANELRRVLARLAASSPQIADALPTVLASDEDRQLLILEWIEGDPLDTVLRRALWRRSVAKDHLHVLRHAARILAGVHGSMAHDVLLRRAFRANGSFVPGFEQQATAFASAFRRTGYDGPDRLLARLSPGFFSRVGDRVALIDARPKNLIVRVGGGLAFIDLDCAPMAPALGVALFLVAIDRLGVRHPYDGAQRRLTQWKQTFVESYREWSGSTFGEDLTFFYPWTLLQMFEQHRRHRPALTSYLRWYYGRRLTSFLASLTRLSPADVASRPGDLFAPLPTSAS